MKLIGVWADGRVLGLSAMPVESALIAARTVSSFAVTVMLAFAPSLSAAVYGSVVLVNSAVLLGLSSLNPSSLKLPVARWLLCVVALASLQVVPMVELVVMRVELPIHAIAACVVTAMSGFALSALSQAWLLANKEHSGVIVDGPYAISRHPRVLGSIVMQVGLASFAPSIPTIVALAGYIAVAYRSAVQSDARLKSKFADYASVRADIPLV